MKTSGEKFMYIEAHPQECTAEELHFHLLALVEELISPQRRARWRLNLIEKPSRAKEHFRDWIPFDDRFCRELTGREGWPQHIEELTGPTPGVYFQPGQEPVKLRASEAASLAAETCADSLLSIIPGRLVVFFNHESQIWLCKK